jgi:SAM-dependent methyltransferase
MICPLCLSRNTADFASDTRRYYCRCNACDLVFVPFLYHLNRDDEIARYSHHHNSRDNTDYVAYLQSLISWIDKIQLVDPTVLDFGCGNQAVLTTLLRERGIPCTAYDPLFDIGRDALASSYDVVIMCEVIEHLRDVGQEIERLREILLPSGRLIVQTELYDPQQPFAEWWYIQDRTHINFFSMSTMAVVAQMLGLSLRETNGKNICVFGPPNDRY